MENIKSDLNKLFFEARHMVWATDIIRWGWSDF